ncbi:MAG: PQQ-binding-like beta-propeller repeat protein [Lentisphaeria bacterium]|nr:PQQ-binding-like beta-propeller repeat protein [Lentisphaeria bacterium]
MYRILLVFLVANVLGAAPVGRRNAARSVLESAGVPGGLFVRVGGTGELAVALASEAPCVVEVLLADSADMHAVRVVISKSGLYGQVTADMWNVSRLPYADGLVNVVLLEADAPALQAEAKRVLAPLGALLLRDGDGWRRIWRKPWPEEIDEWGHYLHDAGNNAVAEDVRIGPPRHLQWTGAPRWSRHHDRLASMSALVSSGGRMFYIFDEGATDSIMLPSKWHLIARDAFNGIVLWKRPLPDWQTRFWPLKSGPAQLPRRLVATRSRVYATMGFDAPVSALDAGTGEVLRVYADTGGTEEILFSDGVLYLAIPKKLNESKYTDYRAVSKPWWDRDPARVVAIDAESGKKLWEHDTPVAPLTLAVAGRGVFLHDGEKVVCLDRKSGRPQWQSVPVTMVGRLMSFFAPTLVVRDGVALFAGGEESGLVKSTGGAGKSDTLTAFDAGTGAQLWTAKHPPSGYSSPEDLFVIGGTVWFEGVSSGSMPGVVRGLDLRTGAVVKEYPKADVETYWFHHRCYRGKAATNFLMTSRTGIEFIDPKTGKWDMNHWIRGGCMYGIMPANGLVYTPPHSCACYSESKLYGFNAVSAHSSKASADSASRLRQGPAFGKVVAASADSADWPTYRHDDARSGGGASVPAELAERWRTRLGGRLSTATVAAGRVFLSQIDARTVVALNTATGKVVWKRIVGGRVDSPPTFYQGTVIFGASDGWITCLRAEDGEVVWQFRAAPSDTRILSYGQLESRWPVSGSVLVVDGVVRAVAGRSLFLDGGMRLLALDAKTGRLVSETVLDEHDPETGENVHSHVGRLTMPVALPDVLSSNGKRVYMRSQVFEMDGKRIGLAETRKARKLGVYAKDQKGEDRHLFSSGGFLDGDWFHRGYWLYGRTFESGWNGYYLSGKQAPAGKILALDDMNVYGYGRLPKFYRWTTAMEYQLFSSPRDPVVKMVHPRRELGSVIRVGKSKSLNPAKSALTVCAWVKSESASGVVLANGGGVLGYSLYVWKGVPRFAVANASKRGEVFGKKRLGKAWTHLAGVLTSDAKLRLYVNGNLVGEGVAPALISKVPANPMQIGADEESPVGVYKNGCPFKGVLDDVRVYRGQLGDGEVAALVAGKLSTPAKSAELVLHYTFDKGKATDASGKKNFGNVVGGSFVPGKQGKGYRLTGLLPGAQPKTRVSYNWSVKPSMLARSMLVAGDRLFVAGPEDVLDETAALKAASQPKMQAAMSAQEEALTGAKGGLLCVLDTTNGKTLQTHRLDTVPVWDGLAAARGCLYLVGVDGTVRCLGGEAVGR